MERHAGISIVRILVWEGGTDMGRNSKHSAVDIIVPIYNGYDDLIRCIESIRRHTDLSKHRVILIDDCSPDPRIRAALTELCPANDEHADHGLITHFNDRNRGFSANVNLGLAWSDRDTILLNSDTIVTSSWVEKMQSCAFRSERIATVTPLSNAATLASVPVFLKDNPLPEGFTVDSYARLVDRVSLRRYPEVSVGVGFCMYVKQEAYEQAGEFDAKTFGRGYGEENDFCFRCSMLGYIHVLCDDTFIYHRGTASFDTEEKRRLIEEHEKILRRRYPQFMKKNDDYCRLDPDSEIRDNLLLHQCLNNGKKNLLYFLHLDFRQIANKSIGGTQLHVRDLVAGARDDFNVFVCARDQDTLRLTVYLEDNGLPEWKVLQSEESADAKGRLISFKFPVGEEEAFPVFYDEKLAKILRMILRSCAIDIVHVHHTQGLSLDIFRVCEKLQIPVIATLHDYYYACPTTKLLTLKGEFCPLTDHFTKTDESVCEKCLHRSCGYGRVKVIDRWREESIRALNVCEKIIFPTRSAMKIMCAAFPALEKKSRVIPHGTDLVSSGSVVIDAPGEIRRTDRVHARLDQIPGDGGSFHYIAGWAYLDGADSIDTSNIIEVTDSDGASFYLKVRKHARPDVAAAAADPNVLWSGIHAVFQVPGLKEGKLRIRLLVQEEKDQSWKGPKAQSGKGPKVWTDGKVYRTSWSHAENGKMNTTLLPFIKSGLLKPGAGRSAAEMPGEPKVSSEKAFTEKVSLVKASKEKVSSKKVSLDRASSVKASSANPESVRENSAGLVMERVNAAYLGGVTPAKGSGALKQLLAIKNAPFNLFIYGEVGDPTVRAQRGADNVFFSGVYQKDDIFDLLKASRIDVALILPVWGETFCYTLSEAWACGIPVIGTDIGAVGERIRSTGAGWLVPPAATGEDICRLLDHIRRHPEELKEKKELAVKLKIRSIEDMNREYRDLYAALLVPSVPVVVKEAGRLEPDFLFQALALANPGVKGRGYAAAQNLLREENEMLRTSMEMLKNTTSYRVARKISEANIPFKEPLKKLLKRQT